MSKTVRNIVTPCHGEEIRVSMTTEGRGHLVSDVVESYWCPAKLCYNTWDHDGVFDGRAEDGGLELQESIAKEALLSDIAHEIAGMMQRLPSSQAEPSLDDEGTARDIFELVSGSSWFKSKIERSIDTASDETVR